MTPDPDASPVNPLPAAVILLALPIVLVELAFQAAAEGYLGGAEGVGWRLGAVRDYGVYPALLTYMAETGRWTVADLLRFGTYAFLHHGFLHMVMVLVFLLALGKMVGEILGSRAVFVIFFGSSLAGALVMSLITSTEFPLIGGYPAVYGLVGGYTFLLQSKLAMEGGNQAQAFTLIGFLLFIQLVFGLLFGAGLDWIAEIGGFGAGYGLSFLLVPGAVQRILRRLRDR